MEGLEHRGVGEAVDLVMAVVVVGSVVAAATKTILGFDSYVVCTNASWTFSYLLLYIVTLFAVACNRSFLVPSVVASVPHTLRGYTLKLSFPSGDFKIQGRLYCLLVPFAANRQLGFFKLLPFMLCHYFEHGSSPAEGKLKASRRPY